MNQVRKSGGVLPTFCRPIAVCGAGHSSRPIGTLPTVGWAPRNGIEMHGSGSDTWSWVRPWCAVGAIAGIVLLATPAQAQSLSDRLVRTITHAQQSDLKRRFGEALIDD